MKDYIGTHWFVHESLFALSMTFAGFKVRKKFVSPSSTSSNSNSAQIRGTIEYISAVARDCPMQFCFPRENGRNPASISLVGLSHRDGMKESASSKISLFRRRSMRGIKAMEPLGRKRPPSVTKSLPRVQIEPPDATGKSLIPSLTTFFKASDCLHSSLSTDFNDSRSSFCSIGCLAISLKIHDIVKAVVSWPVMSKRVISEAR